MPEREPPFNPEEDSDSPPLKKHDWREDGYHWLPEQERKQEFVRQALRELHAFSETMRHVESPNRESIRALCAGVEKLLNDDLSRMHDPKFRSDPKVAREQFERALSPLGLEVKEQKQTEE